MKYEVNYPTRPPVDAISDFVKWARSGFSGYDHATIGLASWNILGYLLRISLGTAAPVIIGKSHDMTTEEALETLERICASECGDGGEKFAISPVEIWSLIRFILMILIGDK